MLLPLTQRNQGGGAFLQEPQTVLVGSDQILWVEPAGGSGASVHLAGGRRVDVLEGPDQILDAWVNAQDGGHQKKAMAERKKARDERQAAEARKKADAEAAAAKALADRAHEEAERHRVLAEAARKRAEVAARDAAAGRLTTPPRPEDLTPDGRPRQSPQIPAGLVGPATVGNVEGSVQGAPAGIGTADAGKEGEPAGIGGVSQATTPAAKSEDPAHAATPPLPAAKTGQSRGEQHHGSTKSGKSSKG